MAVFLRAGDLDSGQGKGCENEGCELWGVRGLIYIERWGRHGKGVPISDTSTLV